MRSFSSMSATHSTKSPIPSKEQKCHRPLPWLMAFRHPRLFCLLGIPWSRFLVVDENASGLRILLYLFCT
jgi:hypothetical protein